MSEEYIVSARKYRPQTFDEVVGQQSLTTTLRNAIQTGKLAHAYLFCGPRGVGKTTCARIFAKTINCLSPLPNGDACNQCESCKAFNEGRSFNIQELDAASNNSVEEIRQLIEQVRIPPQVGKYKVFIIDEVHMLSTAAFNAFLKTLEEPPAHVIFILATTEKHKILPTILSRCQIYDFKRMEVADIVRHLQKVAADQGVSPCEEEALHVIAQKADGGMRDALSIFDQAASFGGGKITYADVIKDLNVLDYEYYFMVSSAVLAHDVTKLLLTFNEILSKGFQGNQFIQGLASHFRNILVSKDAQTLPLLEVAQNVRDRYAEAARQFRADYLYRAMKLCNDCDVAYRASNNKRLLVELTLIQLEQAAEPDDPSSRPSGREDVLKPIFKKEAAAQPTPSSPAQQETAASTMRESSTAYPTPASEAGVSSIVPGHSSQSARKVPVFKKGDVRIAVRLRPSAPSEAAPRQVVSAGKSAPVVEEQKSFTEEQLRMLWLQYAQTLPVTERAVSERMKIMRPTLVDKHVFQVTVENENVKKFFNAYAPAIVNFLRAQLHNSGVEMRIEVNQQEVTLPQTPQQLFLEMGKKNPCLIALKNKFGLDLA